MTSQPNMAPDDKLTARSFWVVLGWLLVLLVIFLSVGPTTVSIPTEEGDKFSHVLAYLVIMSWFGNLYRRIGQRLVLAIGFISLGVGLEFVQRWTGMRTFELWDMVASVTGVVLGWVLAASRFSNYLKLVEDILSSRLEL